MVPPLLFFCFPSPSLFLVLLLSCYPPRTRRCHDPIFSTTFPGLLGTRKVVLRQDGYPYYHPLFFFTISARCSQIKCPFLPSASGKSPIDRRDPPFFLVNHYPMTCPQFMLLRQFNRLGRPPHTGFFSLSPPLLAIRNAPFFPLSHPVELPSLSLPECLVPANINDSYSPPFFF